jgi:hypothetical protein
VASRLPGVPIVQGPSLADQLRAQGLQFTPAPPPPSKAQLQAQLREQERLRKAGFEITPTGTAPPANSLALPDPVPRPKAITAREAAPEAAADTSELAPPPEVAPAAPRPMVAGVSAPAERWRVGPTVRAAFEQAESAQRQAIEQNTALGLEQADREQEAYRQFGEDLAIANQRSEQAEKQRRAVEQSYQEQYDSYANELANEKIDPNRSWNQKNGFEKAAGIAHRFLRGFLIGATGRDIGDQLEAEVARDIDAQKANLANKRATLAAKHGAFHMAMQRFGDERAAEAAARAGMLEQFKTRLGELAAQSQSTQVKQRANELMANLEDRIAQHRAAMMAYGTVGGTAAGTLRMGDDQFVPLGADGMGVMARSGKEGDALRAKIAARDAINSNLQQLLMLDQKAGLADKLNPYSEYNVARDRLIADTEYKKTVFEGQGVMSKNDQEVTDRALGALKGVNRFTGNAQAAIQAAIDGMNSSVDSAIKSQGGTVVRQIYHRAPNGQIVQGYVPVAAQYQGATGPAKPRASFQPVGGKK